MTNSPTQHSQHSSLREKLIEHLFIGKILRMAWQRDHLDIEVLKPEVDRAGYDVAIEVGGRLRYIQLKASFHGATTSSQKFQVRLAEKSGGCIVWVFFDRHTLEFGHFLWFGGKGTQGFPDISQLKIGRHTKANAEGHKAERPAVREVNKGRFERLDSIRDVYDALFGSREG